MLLGRSLAVGVLVWLAWCAADVHANTVPATMQARFDQATEAMASGRVRDAAETFVSIADDAPALDLADDALFTAARLYEERLAEPTRALELYRRLLAAYPDSRTALAARRRQQDIVASIGSDHTGARALARFTRLLHEFPNTGEKRALKMAQDLLDEYAEWSGRARVLSWIADVHQRAGRYDEALSHYLRAVDASLQVPDNDESLLYAYRGAGEAALALERFDDAERYFRQMPIGGDPSRARSLEDALAQVEQQRWRARLYLLSFAFLMLSLVALIALLRTAVNDWRSVVRAFFPPPFEAIFMAPIAGLLIAASMTAHYAIAPAVIIICVGGLALTWLSGAGLVAARTRDNRMSAWRPIIHAVVCVVAVVALSYIAIHHNRLIDMLLETVRFGPDV